MPLLKKDFYGKTVADTIQVACQELDKPQEDLTIEVVETGSNGIFGLIKKKAHIRVTIKAGETDDQREADVLPVEKKEVVQLETGREEKPSKKIESLAVTGDEKEPISEENIQFVQETFGQLLDYMGFPSTVEISGEGMALHCQVESEFEEELAGPEGKTLDALQYLMRKMIARKIPDRLRLAVDIGNFRQKRLEDLKERARKLGEKVRNDGKTQVIPALNPSERRVVHIELQSRKGVKSRSVGEGLFKKVLIYKPGKKKRPSAKRRTNSRPVKKGNSQVKKSE